MSAKNKPYTLGLTGGIGCGKTTCAGILQELGARVVDADEISRRLTADDSPYLSAIRDQFGDGVFLESGSLDRAKMAQTVFADAAKKRQLETILHPAIQKEALREISEATEGIVVLDVPLLFETGMDALCDEVWVLSVDQQTQIERVMARDRITRQDVEQRIDNQMPLEEKEARADRVIRTNRGVPELRQEVKRLYMAMRRKHA